MRSYKIVHRSQKYANFVKIGERKRAIDFSRNLAIKCAGLAWAPEKKKKYWGEKQIQTDMAKKWLGRRQEKKERL